MYFDLESKNLARYSILLLITNSGKNWVISNYWLLQFRDGQSPSSLTRVDRLRGVGGYSTGLRDAASARNRLELRLRNLEPARAGLYYSYMPPSRGLQLFFIYLFLIYLWWVHVNKLSRAHTAADQAAGTGLEAGSPRLRRETSRTGSNRFEQL
jgi:hypothetical protein